MRYSAGPAAISLVLGLVAGLAAGWLACRRRARLAADQERRFSVLHDSLLQDVQGLALSLQAVADQLPGGDPARQQLEQVLDRTDQLLREGQSRVNGGSK